LRAQHNPLVFAQEFLAQFVNLAGVGLFNVAKMLNQGEPWETPALFDIVFATVDSGVKGGQTHDASAVVYVGLNAAFAPLGLYVLDWQAVELGAGDLELWFAGVGRTLNEYAKRARMGSKGVSVECAGLGELLLAKAASLGVRAQEIDPKHVSRGKDLRALSVEGIVNSGRVRLTKPACDRISKLKGVSRNSPRSPASASGTRTRGNAATIWSTVLSTRFCGRTAMIDESEVRARVKDANDPDDTEYRKLVWQDLIGEVLKGELPLAGLMLPIPSDVPMESLLAPEQDAPEILSPEFRARKEKLISAEIERRRIGMIQRENRGRALRGEPLIEP
jgi:hypothetical protein